MIDIRELVERLKKIESAESEGIRLSPEDLSRLLAFVENGLKLADSASALLANSFSVPDDERGIRFRSEDAVKLQWALHEMGLEGDGTLVV
jgi:hypothetical protein